MTLPLLPPGYVLDEVLADRGDVVVVRARRAGQPLVVRLDLGSRAGEGLAELAVLARVQHPGIAPLEDHGPLPPSSADPGRAGGHYVARRWIEGTDLLDWSRERASAEPEEIGGAVARLAVALDHLHRQGFVHGDLKPENVLMGSDGRPVLCDFGLAHRAGRRPREDGVGGTLYHIAPEELLGLEVTPRADLFALGTVLHRLLTTRRRSAAEFYAHFPARSFLDAAGTKPEELPPWARDLVASLTARDPERRPTSAGVVARLLASRLGLELQEEEPERSLRWSVGEGRATWIHRWLAEDVQDDVLGRWVRVPEHEDPRSLWRHLRTKAALAGASSTGVDLRVELEGVETGLAVDAWAERHVQDAGPWLVVLADPLDAHATRALGVLAVACAQERGLRGDRPRLTVVSSESPVMEGWETSDVPLVDRATLLRFLARHMSEEEPTRREAFAAALDGAGHGSATTIDRLLAESTRQGFLLPTDKGFRLRPGELPGLSDDAEALSEPAGLSEPQRALLAALRICGNRADADALLELLELEADSFAGLVVELRAAGWIDLVRTEGRTLVIARRPIRVSAHSLRTLHERRAGIESLSPALRKMHAVCARGDAEADGLADALARMRDDGKAEAALAVCAALREHAELLELDLRQAAPAVLAEESRAWCAIGQPDHALRVARSIPAGEDSRIAALAALAFGRVAALKQQTDVALTHFERAAGLHESARLEATAGKIELWHEQGQDEEVVAAVAALDPRMLEAAGALGARRRAHLEYLSAMSSFRLGRVEEARAKTCSLLAEAQARHDPSLEAALRINLAIIERRTGTLAGARAELDACIELYERSGQISGLAHARRTLGGLLRDLGELGEAEPLLVSAMEIRERLHDPNGARVARGMLGLLLFERGHARAAIEVLEGTSRELEGAHRRRHAPLLLAKAAEMRARIGDPLADGLADSERAQADPRILLSRARVAWLEERQEAAAALASRAAGLAASLKLGRLAQEAEDVVRRMGGEPADAGAPSGSGDDLLATDARLRALLARTGADFDEHAARDLAQALESRGRDDRAARLWFALAARVEDPARATDYDEHARAVFGHCAQGLTEAEANTLRRRLFGEPDPWPGDFTNRIGPTSNEEELEMEIVSLLDINRRLVQQKDLDTLLGVIVEHALEVTGGERGFLVLEEHGELRFDTALDSCRGDIAEPEFEVSQSVVRRALEDGKPVLVSNAVDDPLLGHQRSVISLELRSILCVPIEISESLRAAIYVDHRLRTGAFDARAERLCTLLGDQAALAIQQIRRLEEIRDLNRELERRVIRREADLRTARKALQKVPEASAELVGRSPAIARIESLIEKASPSDLAILIVGDSGTGKEIAARAVHQRSSRSDGPFVSESCAAIPASLIEAELFGHKKGAFTGADRDRVGLIERAQDGTLFLDEIGEMPAELQAKLLRVLETGEVRRIGDDATRKVDFRLVVATNRDLEREIAEGGFRQDLYYRINGLRIDMPPLSGRAEDIPLLVEHFLDLEAEKDGKRRRVSRSVLAALARRPWPGNVRELRNEVARLCVLCEGALDDPSLISRPQVQVEPDEARGIVPLAELERRAILRALEETGGDKRQAAALLGISRAKIYQKLKEWSSAGASAQ